MSYEAFMRRVAAMKAGLKLPPAPRPRPAVVRAPVVRAAAAPVAATSPAPVPVAPPPPARAPGGKQTVVVSVKALRAQARREERLNGPPAELPELERPKVRGDCEGGDRPCPFVGCKHHLYLEVERSGSIKFNHPGKEPEDLAPDASCALDVADGGGVTLEKTGELLNLTRERTRQVEQQALARAAATVDEDLVPRRFKKQCKARDSETGLQCGLLEHDAKTAHRSARGEFHQVAVPGQTSFSRRDALDAVAMLSPGALGVE